MKRVSEFMEFLYSPRGRLRPKKAETIKMLEEHKALKPGELDGWKKEAFVCVNEGVEIFGEFFPAENSNVCVILVHGYGQNRYIMIPQQKIFREMGFHTLLFDQRAFGESKEKYCTFGVWEAQDVACLVEWVKKKVGPDVRIIAWGASMGAAIAMNALKYTEDIDGVGEDSGYADILENVESLYQSLRGEEDTAGVKACFLEKAKKIGVDMESNKPIEALKASKVPVCIIHGEEDSVIDRKNAVLLSEAICHERYLMEIFEGRGHALCVEDGERYRLLVKRFLEIVL